MLEHNPVLIGVELFASAVWIGSLVCLIIVAGAARSSLDRGAQVAFFRSLGRRYGIVGNLALAVTVGVGLAMLWPPSRWGALQDAVVALAGVVVIFTALGVRQARAMTRLRRASLDEATAPSMTGRVKRGARTAVALRGVMAVASLAILSLVAVLISG